MNIRIALPAVICLLALSLPAAAQEAPATTLTLEQILAAAATANPALESLALQQENARVAFNRTSASSEARSDQMSATLQWERAQLSFRQGTVRELLSIAEAYVALQQANEEMSLLQERWRLAQLDLQLATARVEVGAAGATEELQAQVAALTAELNLAGEQNQRRFNTLPSLADMTGMDAAVLAAATLTSEPPALPDVGAPDSYSEAASQRVEHQHAALQLEIDELNLKLLSAENTSGLDLQTATNTVASSRAAAESTAVSLQTATASAYATAQQAFGTAALRELQLTLQQERTRRTEEQFAAGALTPSELASAQADLIGALNALRAARWSAYFAWLRLQDASGIDLPVIPGIG